MELFHLTTRHLIPKILQEGLHPELGKRSSQCEEEEYLFGKDFAVEFTPKTNAPAVGQGICFICERTVRSFGQDNHRK